MRLKLGGAVLAKGHKSFEALDAETHAIKPGSWESLDNHAKAEIIRMQLYQVHKERGSLGTYYQLYPDHTPPGWHEQADRGRERER